MTTTEPTELTYAAREYLRSPVDHLANIPWPFPDELERFSYSVNVEPARIRDPPAAANGAGIWWISVVRST